jgi:hypothetical protein
LFAQGLKPKEINDADIMEKYDAGDDADVVF